MIPIAQIPNRIAPGECYSGWYERSFQDLHHHGLWLRGGELNTLPSTEYERRSFRVLLTRLSTYYDTGYSFTHQLLYQIAARTEGVFPDLAYLPPRADVPLFARDSIPWLLGTQSKRGPDGFDLVGFSNSIVQEILNLPHFLWRSGIPLEKSARMERAELPLLILGGANALYTSSIWCEEPPVDGIFVGEDDRGIRAILETCRDAKRAGLAKRELLAELERIDGFFQPDRPRRTRKNFILNLNKSEALECAPVYYLEDQLGSSHLQISEGCPCFCSFCAESWDRKPYRERKAAVLKEAALNAKAAMGLEEIDIYSFNFNMHSGFYQILWDLVPHFRSIGLKSQRFDLLAHDPEMVEFQHAIEKASLTCGLEGISPRLRNYLHKNLEDQQLHDSLAAIFRSKARELKVFLIATGLEEEQDFLAFADLVEHMQEIRNAARATTRVIFSMTPLVRFPWTPLEFEDAFPPGRYHGIIRAVAERARAGGFEFRESTDLPESWVSQVLVRAANEGIYGALIEALRETEYIYYRDIPDDFMRAFAGHLRARGISEERAVAGHSLEESHAKPWAAVDTGVKREFLWQEVVRARAFAEIDYCLGRSWTKAKCFHCGGCPTREHVRDLVLAKQERNYTLAAFKERIREARSGERTISMLLDVGERGRGVPRKLVAVALARALMLAEPALRLHYRGYAGSYWENSAHFPLWIIGEDVLKLRWHAEAAPLLQRLAADASELERVNAELSGWGTLLGLAPEDWAPARIAVESPYACEPDDYLRALHHKYTTRRISDAEVRFEFSGDSLRRGHLRGLALTRNGAARHASLVPGPKFDPESFARGAFKLPAKNAWVRIRMTAMGG